MTAGTNRIITLLIVASVFLMSIPTFAGKIIYVDAKRHFRFQYPKTWKLTTGRHILNQENISFLTINNLGKENFWLIHKIGEEPEVILSELPRASIYLDIGWFEYSMVDRWQIKKDEAGQDLTGVLKTSPEKLLENGQAHFRKLSFWKWGRCWKINTFIVEPVSNSDKKKLENVLKSFCFDAVPTGDEFWAAGLAREHLWPQANPHEFPLKGSQENNSVHTVKRGDDVLVTFTTTAFKNKEPKNVWQFRVSPSGEVIPIPGRKNVPLQESPWGREHNGLQCQVLTWTEIEQGMPLNTTVNLRCLPENVEPGVEQLNTFLHDAFLTLSLTETKTKKVVTIRPYDPTLGMSAVDRGQNAVSLNGSPLEPWEVSFPLVRERDALEPGLYECTVEYSFPKEKTQWWHRTKDWESFGFWHGTIISGSFQLKILEEIPKTKQLLVPKRLRYSQEERKVYYTKQDAVKIEVPLRNGFYIGTWIRKGDRGRSLNSGPPVPHNISAVTQFDNKAKDKNLSFTIEVFETSDPPCHLWHPGPGSGDYKILWKKSFEFDVDENTESKKWGDETEENRDLWLLAKACLP